MFQAIVTETMLRIREAFARRPLAGVATASELDRAFQLERARSHRNGNQFSLVAFESARGKRDDIRSLVRILRNRVRSTDVIGTLDPSRIGVLLPETPSKGAWTFADDVVARLARTELAFDCKVFTYPIDWPKEKEEDNVDRDGRRAVGDGLGGLELLGSSTGHQGPHGLGNGGVTNGAAHFQASHEVADDDGLAHVRHTLGRRPVADLSTLFARGLPAWKRVMDILTASILLILLSPLMLAVAVAIRLTSPGPIIFRQKRAGLSGRPFLFLKFRSMYINAEQEKKALEGFNEVTGPVFKMRQDPRITPVGRFIRRLSIDEIPQLLNVLRGEMTLVGPRPPILSEVERYEAWQRHRLNTTGGLTCIWQVSGRSNVAFIDWMRMDLQYIAKRSLLFDLSLLAKTAGAVLSRRGAY